MVLGKKARPRPASLTNHCTERITVFCSEAYLQESVATESISSKGRKGVSLATEYFLQIMFVNRLLLLPLEQIALEMMLAARKTAFTKLVSDLSG